MGLDMYLDKVKVIDGASIDDIRKAEDYMEYLLRPSKYAECSLEKWCGIPESEVNIAVVDNYLCEYKTRYFGWDNDHKYGRLGLFDGVGYWRKANQIHNWFVENVQNGIDDCKAYEVTEEKLRELLNTCKMVKRCSKLVKGKVSNGEKYESGRWVTIWEDGKYIEDPSVAEKLLPTTDGFFFGGVNYDQWYMEDICNTIKILTKVLNETDFENEAIVYSSSW